MQVVTKARVKNIRLNLWIKSTIDFATDVLDRQVYTFDMDGFCDVMDGIFWIHFWCCNVNTIGFRLH